MARRSTGAESRCRATNAGNPAAEGHVDAVRKLRARGAIVTTEVLDSPCPHMFPCFESPAQRLAEVDAGPYKSR
jgi:hypothetical protein